MTERYSKPIANLVIINIMTNHSRRRLLKLGASGLIASLAGCAGSPGGERSADSAPGFSPWPFPHRTKTRANATPDAAPEGDLQPQWTVGPDGFKPDVIATPLVTSEAVYGPTPDAIVGASRQDGSQLFISDYDTSGAMFVDNEVIVTHPEKDARLLGLQTTDGKRAWFSPLPGATDQTYAQLRLYPVDDRLFYITELKTDNLDGTGAEFGVVTLEDRSQRWRERIRIESGDTLIVGGVADSSATRVFIARVERNKFDIPKEDAQPTVEAYDLDSGERHWRRDMHARPLAAHDGRLFAGLPHDGVISALNLDGIVALETDTGEEVWRRTSGASRVYRRTLQNGLAVDSDGLYIPQKQGLSSLDPTDGATQWQYPTPEPVVTKPAAAANAVVVGSRPRLHVVSKSDGTQLATRQLEFPRSLGGLTGHVAVAGGVIYVGMSQGLRGFASNSDSDSNSN